MTTMCAPCPGCQTAQLSVDSDTMQTVCEDCARRLPASLAKALVDPFFYAVRLRTGELLEFERAYTHGDFVSLHGLGPDGFDTDALPFNCPRGIDVRIADIVWCADAPRGS